MALSMSKHLYVDVHKLYQSGSQLIRLSAGHGACLQAITTLVQALEDGKNSSTPSNYVAFTDFTSTWSFVQNI